MNSKYNLKSILFAALNLLLLAVVTHKNFSFGQRQFKQAINCTNISDVLDRCGGLASYSHTIPGSAYPTTAEELKEACPKHNEGLHCLRQHVKCLKPLTKRAILSFIESRRKHVKKLCSDPRGQAARDFTEAFKCIRKHKKEKFVQSEIKAIQRIDAILSNQVKDFKERFQRSCCSINHYRQRTVEDMGPECANPQMIAAVETALDSVVGEAIEFACPDAKSSVCTSMKELVLSKVPSNKTLTRAGTDLMIVLTAPDGNATTFRWLIENATKNSGISLKRKRLLNGLESQQEPTNQYIFTIEKQETRSSLINCVMEFYGYQSTGQQLVEYSLIQVRKSYKAAVTH